MLSKCCKKQVEPVGLGDFNDADEVVTQYYQCSGCKKPCEILPYDPTAESDFNRFVNENLIE